MYNNALRAHNKNKKGVGNMLFGNLFKKNKKEYKPEVDSEIKNDVMGSYTGMGTGPFDDSEQDADDL